MRDIEQAHRYLVMAEKDAQAVKGMQDEVIFSIEVFGFHAQQAVEKALKAWLCGLGVVFPKIHDLDELSAILHDNGATIPAEFEWLLSLTDFAVTFRYDVVCDIEEAMERSVAAESIASFIAHVRNIIDETCRS